MVLNFKHIAIYFNLGVKQIKIHLHLMNFHTHIKLVHNFTTIATKKHKKYFDRILRAESKI